MVRFSPGCKCCEPTPDTCRLCDPLDIGTSTQNEYDVTFFPETTAAVTITVQGQAWQDTSGDPGDKFGCCNWLWTGVMGDINDLYDPSLEWCSLDNPISVVLSLCQSPPDIQNPNGVWTWSLTYLNECIPPSGNSEVVNRARIVWTYRLNPADELLQSTECDLDQITPDPWLDLVTTLNCGRSECDDPDPFFWEHHCLNCDDCDPVIPDPNDQCYFPSNVVRIQNVAT